MGFTNWPGEEVRRLKEISERLGESIFPTDPRHVNYGYVREMGVRMHEGLPRIEVNLERDIPANLKKHFPGHFEGESITYI